MDSFLRSIIYETEKSEFISIDGSSKVINVTISKQKLNIFNHNDFPIFCSIYTKLRGDIKNILYQFSDIYNIPSNDNIIINKPSHICIKTHKPKLLVSSENNNLVKSIVGTITNRITSHSIYSYTSSLHIAKQRNLLIILNNFHWEHFNKINSLSSNLSNVKKSIKESTFSKIEKDILNVTKQRDIPDTVRSDNRNLGNNIKRDISSTLVIPSPKDSRYFIPKPCSLPQEELNALNNRNNITKKALLNFLGENNDYFDNKKIPKLSICFSGGGYRALVSTLGYLKGWQNIGLLDCITYISCLSGSIWAITLWLCFNNDFDKILQTLEHKLSLSMKDCFTKDARNVLSLIIKQRKILNLPSQRLMQLYRVLLASQLLYDVLPSGFTYSVSNLKTNVINGKSPIPIFTSVFKEPHDYEWLEITPFEVGSEYIGSFISVDSFGSSFKEGKLSKIGPLLTLSNLFSFGTSAICLTIKTLLLNTFGDLISNNLPNSLPANTTYDDFSDNEDFINENTLNINVEENNDDMTILSKKISEYNNININDNIQEENEEMDKDKRIKETDGVFIRKIYNLINEYDWLADKYIITPEIYPNFAYRMNGPMKAQKFLKLVDAGFAFCLPIPPLVRECRYSDIIFMVEMSAPPNCQYGISLLDAANWCITHNVKFPVIDKEKLKIPFNTGKDQTIIFEDPNDPEIPTIIYIVLQKNKYYSDFDPVQNQLEGGFCSTFNHFLTKEQIDLLSGLTCFTAESIENIIKDAIRNKINIINQ